MGVPYSIFCCQIERLESLIAAATGTTYTGSNGVQLIGLDFQADATIARIASPALTGIPRAPTAAVATNTTQIATTAFVLANSGGSYTSGDGLALVGSQFAVDSTVARKTLTLAQFSATTSAQLAALISNETGTNLLVFNTNPSIDGPRIINGIQDSSGNKVHDFATVALAVNSLQSISSVTGSGPTLTVQGLDANIDLNLSGLGTTGGVKYKTLEIGFRAVPSNSKSAAYTTVLEDSGKAIDHPVSDNVARAFTIDGSLAYPIGTCITFCNMAATACTIPITTDTMYLAGVGSTGTRTLAQYGVATARKHAAGVWIISGVGLT